MPKVVAKFGQALARLVAGGIGAHAEPQVTRVEQRLRLRRAALWLASVGIDTGPRCIHGVEVAR